MSSTGISAPDIQAGGLRRSSLSAAREVPLAGLRLGLEEQRGAARECSRREQNPRPRAGAIGKPRLKRFETAGAVTRPSGRGTDPPRGGRFGPRLTVPGANLDRHPAGVSPGQRRPGEPLLQERILARGPLPQCRWDYVLVARDESVGMEVDPKASEVDKVIKKMEWASQRLTTECGLGVARWHRIRPNGSRLQLTHLSPKAHLIAKNGIKFPSARLASGSPRAAARTAPTAAPPESDPRTRRRSPAAPAPGDRP